MKNVEMNHPHAGYLPCAQPLSTAEKWQWLLGAAVIVAIVVLVNHAPGVFGAPDHSTTPHYTY